MSIMRRVDGAGERSPSARSSRAVLLLTSTPLFEGHLVQEANPKDHEPEVRRPRADFPHARRTRTHRVKHPRAEEDRQNAGEDDHEPQDPLLVEGTLARLLPDPVRNLHDEPQGRT